MHTALGVDFAPYFHKVQDASVAFGMRLPHLVEETQFVELESQASHEDLFNALQGLLFLYDVLEAFVDPVELVVPPVLLVEVHECVEVEVRPEARGHSALALLK